MKFTVEDLIRLLMMVGPIIAQTKEFIERFELLISAQGPEDQAKLREAREVLIVENDAGHDRLQAMLAEAADTGGE
ncbi:hypothetical protein [Croceicoccus naphthovorans]|uniref:Uncharacterized protein n=1 Tax=Croceicoccus naphthovorans TaxID=1348774 RepID=A0A0G3XEB2_9SPHN|nr:hypothetical protein [Croceicoccus naphthovorans]AKM09890.1 hypothetical protein AB433_07670 [Croceicoccus naphthovorans]MBB3991354.1 hypothetical protein [Croceicoccus naphthovorans]